MHPGPFPLATVPVPIVEEHVHQSGGKECATVEPLTRVAVQQLQQVAAVDDLARAGKAIAFLRDTGVQLDHAEGTGELLAKLAEQGVVRHDDEDWRYMEHAGGVEHRSGEERAR